MSEEIWKPIPGYEDAYEASNTGFIRSLRFRNKQKRAVMGVSKCLGYFSVQLCVNGRPKPFRVHRLVALTFIGIPPAGTVVNHKNGNKSDNRVENLEYVTQKQNVHHSRAVLKRRGLKLTEDVARGIITLWSSGLNIGEIAQQFGITGGCIRDVLSGRTWRYVTDETPLLREYTPRKISDSDASQMRKFRQDGWKVQDIADHFGVHLSYAARIVKGEARA